MNIIRRREASCIISIPMPRKDFDRIEAGVLSELELANRTIKAPLTFANFDDDPEMLHLGFSDYLPENNGNAIREITVMAEGIKLKLFYLRGRR
jgi:hypothetical protein